MSIFSYGSIEDAPLDALPDGKNPNNPISKGHISIPTAWKLSSILALMGLIFSVLGYPKALLVHLGLLLIGGFYFHRTLNLRRSTFLDALGFSILTGFLPFISAANLRSIHFGNTSLVTGTLSFFLTYATYYTLVGFQEKGAQVNSSKPRLSLEILVLTVLIILTSLFLFTFIRLIPAWVSLLMLVLFIIMIYPQFIKHSSIQTATNLHLVFANYQRALAISLVTFFLATQIFNILR